MDPKKSRYYTYIRPFLKNKAVNTYSSFVFSIVTIAIFSVYAIQPTASTIISLQKSIKQQNEILQQLDTKVANLTQGRRNYENLDSNLKTELASLLPYSPALPNLVNELTILSKVSDASISGIQFEQSELQPPPKNLNKNAGLGSVEFTVNATSKYKNLISFLDGIKTLNRLVSINNVTFSKPEDGDIVMSIHGKALYLKN